MRSEEEENIRCNVLPCVICIDHFELLLLIVLQRVDVRCVPCHVCTQCGITSAHAVQFTQIHNTSHHITAQHSTAQRIHDRRIFAACNKARANVGCEFAVQGSLSACSTMHGHLCMHVQGAQWLRAVVSER